MKKYFIIGILSFFIPIWLALLFLFGQNTAAHLLNSKEKNLLSLENINFPKLYLVQSGSMSPAIPVGSVVIVNSNPNYVAGNIISFDIKGDGKTIVTHRIVYKDFPNGINSDPVYITKGDANEDFDSVRITNKNIIGKVQVIIPYLGYLALWAKKPWGFILLVIVPATILIYEELKTIFSEAKKGARKMFGKRRFEVKQSKAMEYEADSHPERSEGSPTESNILKKLLKSSAYFIPIFGAGIVFISLSSSFFSDKEETLGNFFQASSNFGGTPTPIVTPIITETPTPTPTPIPISDHIVINEVYYRVASQHRMGSEAGSEWAELYNPTDSPINLTGWSIRDNTACDNIPGSLVIPPQEFAILASRPLADFELVWGTLPPGTIYIESPTAIGNGLANNDELLLQQGVCTSSVTVIDHISWGSNTNGLNPSISTVNSSGISLERSPDGKDTDSNLDFVNSNPPTPGG